MTRYLLRKKGCRISGEYAYTSKPYAVKYRGWFVNDEVLIHKWYVDRKKGYAVGNGF